MSTIVVTAIAAAAAAPLVITIHHHSSPFINRYRPPTTTTTTTAQVPLEAPEEVDLQTHQAQQLKGGKPEFDPMEGDTFDP